MIHKTRIVLMLAAATAASGLIAGNVAMAQYRVGSDGRALDANNRVGSGGINDAGRQRLPYGFMGNNVVTGNVTAGREFRGFVPYTDPTAFRGPTAGSLSDQFIKNSAGTPYGSFSQNNASVVRPYYGESRAAPAPAGFVEQSIGSGAFVPAPAVSRAPSDLRLGQVYDSQVTVLPQPGQLVLPGPVDPNTQTSTLITASPLYGVRQWNPANEADQGFLENNLGGMTATPLDPVAIERMKEEMAREQDLTGEEVGAEGAAQQNRQSLGGALPAPYESPQNQALGADARVGGDASRGGTQTALSGNLLTGEGTRQRLLTAPARQSTQYAELQKRLERYRTTQQLGDAAASRAFAEQMREKQAADAAAAAKKTDSGAGVIGQPITGGTAPGATGQAPGLPSAQPPVAQQPGMPAPALPGAPAAQPGDTATPPAPAPIAAAPARPQPLQIRSLGEGTPKALGDLLREAETLLKSGKFNTALEQYDMAEQVAPNNPLILVGRANAELAQSYYTRAEQHLRQAFMQDQALLMGQYDLRAMLGQERLEFLVRDLKEIAKREQKESRPLFLLAYIAYNTGAEPQAAAYLDLAEKRAGDNDPLFPLVRKHWALPAVQDQAGNEELNK